jgi:hypothetical protein
VFSQVPNFAAWFPELDGFPRPDWKAIRAWILVNVAPDQLANAWQAICREWLDQLRERFGGTYAVAESPHFLLLSALEGKQQGQLLAFLEDARARIIRRLGDVPFPRVMASMSSCASMKRMTTTAISLTSMPRANTPARAGDSCVAVTRMWPIRTAIP